MKNPLEGVRNIFAKSENAPAFDKAAWTATLDAHYPEFRGGLILGGFSENDMDRAERELFDKVNGNVEAITDQMLLGTKDIEK
jgi:hypothetical protein